MIDSRVPEIEPSNPGRIARDIAGRVLVAGVILLGVASLRFVRTAAATELTAIDDSPHTKVLAVGLSEVQWTEGFWAQRFATCRDRSIPAMWELMKGDQYKPYYQHFLIAAGDMEGRHRGAKWNDGDFYKWIEAASSVLAVERNKELERTVDECIRAIGRAQREDGYIHTPVLIAHRNGDRTAQPFQDRHNFEMYNMGHLITAACLHYRVTGKDSFLTLAEKTASFLEETFTQPTPELARNSVCPSHYMAMVELYRTTQKARYLDLAKTFLEMRNIMREGGDDNQDRMPFIEQREAIGHAVRANYLFAGAADLYLETGDTRYMETLDAIWDNVTRKKLYITGGCGALYDGASPDGSKQQSRITRVHQAYGRNYQLPNTTAHNETCAAIGSVLWNWRMYLATGESRFIDLLELTLYNAVLCGVSLEGTDYFYVNPLRNEQPLPAELRWSRTRVPFVTSYCCPPNVLRTIAQVNGYAYAKRDDALVVNLYGSNELKTELLNDVLSVQQQTDYPWSPNVLIEIDQCPDKPFSLELRIPGWASDYRITLNGQAIEASKQDTGYVAVYRQWHAKDQVVVEFPMPVQLIEAHPLVEENRNQVAVKRGPLVYCLESHDLPEGVRVREIGLNSNTQFQPTRLKSLPGLACLEARVEHCPEQPWTTLLYRPLDARSNQRVRAKFVPYFAWANRGEAEMSVWVPLVAK